MGDPLGTLGVVEFKVGKAIAKLWFGVQGWILVPGERFKF